MADSGQRFVAYQSLRGLVVPFEGTVDGKYFRDGVLAPGVSRGDDEALGREGFEWVHLTGDEVDALLADNADWRERGWTGPAATA